MKRIVLLSSAQSVHTIRWANALSKYFDIYLISQHSLRGKLNDHITYIKLKYSGYKGYFLNAYQLKSILSEIEPDILHAHFASGYGTLAANSGFPYIVSVWGSDVYDFPYKSKIHRYFLRRALSKANSIFSTSTCMKQQTNKFTDKDIKVVPFGVDLELITFQKRSLIKNDIITIGTIKVLAEKYGIEYLIEAFSLLTRKYKNLELKIIGDGPSRKKLECFSRIKKVSEKTEFVGWVDNSEINVFLKEIDIFVVPSILDSESFGVAAVEASASAIPCIVSNVGGLPEVVKNNETGFVVEKENAQEIADKIALLIDNELLYKQLSLAARRYVENSYDWNENVFKMVSYYKEML